MALTAHSNVASLMQRALERQTAIARTKFKLKPNQVKQILYKLVRENCSGPYVELLKVLRGAPVSDENFKYLFEDCKSCVVILGRELKPLLDVVCSIEWSNRDPHLMDLYMGFILDLVTAHNYHLPLVMTYIMKQLKDVGENHSPELPDKVLASWSNIHKMIAQVVSIMPMSVDVLNQALIDQFPYYKAGCDVNRAYVHNLIWITKYIPALREQIMSTIINRLVVMDVNIVDKSKNKSQPDIIFAMEDDSEAEVQDALDFCMLEILQWLQDERDVILVTMCTVFERIILPTYGIRHVQFLLLYTISISQQCADRVLSNLWIIAAGLHSLGPGALATRRTAASHLAGLLARCVRVPNTRLVQYLRNMVEWCHSYITATQESTSACDNNKVHGAFYAICHAAFYLVAYKHQYLFHSKESINFLESLNLSRIVTCPLNPLRTCPPEVCRTFAAVTRAHQLLYCQAILEKNSRHTLVATVVEQYDEWFPYDPFTLPRSGEIIWPLCTEYKDWFTDGVDETQYSSMKRKLETEDDDFLLASPHSRLASSLSHCISPGFKTM